MRFIPRLRPVATVIVLSTVLVASLIVLFFLLRHREKPDVRLASPLPLLREMARSGSPVYVTPEFLPFVASLPTNQKPLFPSPGDSREAAREKFLFWRLNREHRFTAALIGVSPAWRPLLDSLLDSHLWILSDVSPWGFLFEPKLGEITAWHPPSEQEIEKEWPTLDARALFLILTAANLITIHRNADAEELLVQAAATHRLTSLLLSTQASIAASRGHWEEAATLAQASLGKDYSNSAAREILIRALIETGQADEALAQARDLISRNGENENTLFLLARTANAAHSRQEEVDALTRLVSAAKNDHQPLGASLTYLGQAYAKDGQRGNALRTLQQAILAPELTDEERKQIRDVMDHLMEGNASSTTLPSLPTSPENTNP